MNELGIGAWAKFKANILQSIKIYRLVLQPDGKIRIGWDLVGMLFILYELLMIPLKISFDFDTTGFVDGFEWLIDIFFFSDIILNFNTGTILPHYISLIDSYRLLL